MTSELTSAQQMVLRFIEERADCGEAPPTYREICKRFGYKSPKAATDHVAALEMKGFLTRDKRQARGLRLNRPTKGIPLLGSIAAGMPSDAILSSDECLPFDPAHYGILNRNNAYALRVTGDSMIGRQIFEGDVAILENGIPPKDGDVVAALIDNESTLKTLVRKGEKVWLRAENPRYPDLIPALDLQIQGVCRATIRFLTK